MTTTYQCAGCRMDTPTEDVAIIFRADDDLRVVNICYECDKLAWEHGAATLTELTAARDSVTVRPAPRG